LVRAIVEMDFECEGNHLRAGGTAAPGTSTVEFMPLGGWLEEQRIRAGRSLSFQPEHR